MSNGNQLFFEMLKIIVGIRYHPVFCTKCYKERRIAKYKPNNMNIVSVFLAYGCFPDSGPVDNSISFTVFYDSFKIQNTF